MILTKYRTAVVMDDDERSVAKVCEIARRDILRMLNYRPLIHIKKATARGVGRCSFRKAGTGKKYSVRDI